jgi:AcrR family transcriptional regulator
MGSADYMAPEQGSNPRDIDARADVYALGCTLYCFLAGRPPFGDQRHSTFLAKVVAHANEDVVPIDQIRPDVPSPLMAILNKMLAKNPGNRCSTAAEVAELLTPLSAGSDLARLLTDPPSVRPIAPTKTDVAYSDARPKLPISAGFMGHVLLADRQRPKTDDFGRLIEEKTRQFVGRCREVAEIRRWMDRNECGFCLIRGNPGIGKSALMSALSQIASDSPGHAFDSPRFAALLRSDAWPKVAVIPYFIVRGEITANPVEFLTTLLDNIGRTYDLPCVTAGNADELASELHRQLHAASKILQERGEKLLLLIDGLDESISAEGEASVGASLLRFIPRDVPPGIFFVLAGRRRKEVDVFSSDLKKLHEMELQGLNEDDVRELLQLTINQSDLESDYVEQVTKLSEGNPLYLKLLLQALREGQMRLNDIRSLPKNIQDSLEKILNRLLAKDRGVRLNVLMAVALAREQFTVEQIAGIAEQSLAEVDRALDACAEVITERRNVNGRAVYRLFHDSFADYLRSHKDYASHLPEMSRRILRFAARRVPDRPAEPELLELVERLFDGTPLHPVTAGLLSQLIERTSRLLTGHSLMQQNLLMRPFEESGPLLAALGRCIGAATARMTIDCLVAAVEQQPAEVGGVLLELVQNGAIGRGALVVQANAQAARVALEVVVQTCHVASMNAAVRTVLLAACSAVDSNVRSLAIVSTFRLVHAHHTLGMSIMQELARRSVRFGMIRPRGFEVFACCAVGLFYERPRDEHLVRELKQMVRSFIGRVWGVRLAMLLAPKAATVLWSSVSDDYNNVNLAEMKAYKKYAGGHRDFVAVASEMIDFIDPAYGTKEAFSQAVRRLDEQNVCLESLLGYLPTQQAVISRALAGDESALEAAYESWQHAPQYAIRQDFMYRLRIVQVGRRLAGWPPLGQQWTDRMKTAVREFIVEQRGIHQGACRTYTIGSVITGIVFLAHQQGDCRVDLLRELIDWASAGQQQMFRWPETPRERQADALLLRVLEVMGIETGLFDPLSRETVYFGIQCFLEYAWKFDEFVWGRIATVLARMNIYNAGEVARFLAKISDEHRESLQVRMNQVLPKEGIGTLVSPHRAEAFYARVFSEPPGKKDGLRSVWQECLRDLLGPISLSKTLRNGLQRLYGVIQSDTNTATS